MNEGLLLADGDIVQRGILASFLREQNFEVCEAGSGKDAIRLAYQHHPSLVILELDLAELDGISTCLRLREMSDVPIMFLTGRCREADILAGLEAGADDYLTKPAQLVEMEARIRAVLRRCGPAQRPAEATYDDGNLPRRYQATSDMAQRRADTPFPHRVPSLELPAPARR